MAPFQILLETTDPSTHPPPPPPIPPENYVILKSLKWLGGRILSSAKEDEEKDLPARELKIMLIFQSCCVPRESWDVLRNRSHVENAEPPRSGGEAAAHCRAMFCCSGWCFQSQGIAADKQDRWTMCRRNGWHHFFPFPFFFFTKNEDSSRSLKRLYLMFSCFKLVCHFPDGIC